MIWDSGASVCITPDRYDFLNFSSKPTLSRLNSVGGGHDVDGEGEVLWSIVYATRMLRQLKVKAYYVPTSRVRLLSTNALLQHYPDETMKHDRDSLVLSGVSGDRSRNSIIVDLHHTSRLPISTAYRYGTAFSFSDVSEAAVLSVTSAENANLSEAEKELLRWHFKLGHIAFSKVQHLMRSGILAHSEGMRRLHKAASSLKNAPKCAACAFAKQRVRSSPGRKITTIHDVAGKLRENTAFPGKEVSVDHFICSCKGRLFTSKGKSTDSDMYCGGCIFVDHCSSYIFVDF